MPNHVNIVCRLITYSYSSHKSGRYGIVLFSPTSFHISTIKLERHYKMVLLLKIILCSTMKENEGLRVMFFIIDYNVTITCMIVDYHQVHRTRNGRASFHPHKNYHRLYSIEIAGLEPRRHQGD